MQNATIFAGVSVLIATVVAIFAGSYLSVRLARFKVDVVGCSQGLVVASLMVVFMSWQALSAVGELGQVAGQATGVVAQNAAVQDMIEDSLGGSTLKSEPLVVVRGVSSRLLRDDQEGAKQYLAWQAGLTPEEADGRIAALKARADQMMIKAREASATAMKASGWTLFLMISLSAIASVLGGLLATQVNIRRTMDIEAPVVVRRRESKILEKASAR